MASNATGTINPVAAAARIAHEAGALCFVDAVHYAPHGPIDVAAIGCDLLACSAYKFFGPHIGVLWGRHELMDRLPPTRCDPPGTRRRTSGKPARRASSPSPARGRRRIPGVGGQDASAPRRLRGQAGPRSALKAGMSAIRDCEAGLSRAMLDGLSSIKGLTIHGITDPARLDSARADLLFHPGRMAPAADLRGAGQGRGSTPRTATTTRWRSPRGWAWRQPAAWCAWAPRTTTRSRR